MAAKGPALESQKEQLELCLKSQGLKGKACKNVPLLRPSSNLPWVLGWLLESLGVDGASSFAASFSKPNAIDLPHAGQNRGPGHASPIQSR